MCHLNVCNGNFSTNSTSSVQILSHLFCSTQICSNIGRLIFRPFIINMTGNSATLLQRTDLVTDSQDSPLEHILNVHTDKNLYDSIEMSSG